MSKSEIAVQSNIWDNNSVLRQKRRNNAKQNYMPFLFRSKRQFLQIKDRIPPVGSYEVLGCFQNVKQVQQSPSILKEQMIRQNQMSIFKSKQQRFNNKSNQVPGPASYNYKENQSKLNKKYSNFNKFNLHTEKNYLLSHLKKSPSCPAIPDSKVRYGYQKDNEGNYKLITKTEQQVIKQKQKLKEYCTTLVGQTFNNQKVQYKVRQTGQIKKKEIISTLGKYVSKTQDMILQQTQSDAKRLVKPKINLSHQINYVKPTQKHLGPGCYNVSLDTLKKNKKNQAFQFFGSSQIRFGKAQKQNDVTPYENIFKQKINVSRKHNFPGKIIKKSFNNNFDPFLIQKQENPGPGYYEPEYSNVKKSQGNVKFCSESRFKQNLSEEPLILNDNQIDDENKKINWGNLQKQKIQSPHKYYQPVNEKQIYGIMNEQPSSTSAGVKKHRLKQQKNKSSPVFLDKSQRFNLCQQSPYQEFIGNLPSKCQAKHELNDTKGSFISRLQKKDFQQKQITPGPGAYLIEKNSKRSFNIRNQ